MISQVEHIPNLLRARRSVRAGRRRRSLEDLARICQRDLRHRQLRDAGAAVRPETRRRRHRLARPAASRAGAGGAASAACMSSAKSRSAIRRQEIAEIIAARDKAGKVMQVGYMKRFDPSYRLALTSLPGTAKTLRSRLGRGQRSRRLAVHRPPALCPRQRHSQGADRGSCGQAEATGRARHRPAADRSRFPWIYRRLQLGA